MSAASPLTAAVCSGCSRPIVWVDSPTGRLAVDATPAGSGTVLVRDGRGWPISRAADRAKLRAHGTSLHAAHSPVCALVRPAWAVMAPAMLPSDVERAHLEQNPEDIEEAA